MMYRWIGHCKEGTSDKVWGIILIGEATDSWNQDFIVFWGRRGRTLSTKIYRSYPNYQASKLIESKENKGYRQIDVGVLDSVYPDFEQDLERTAVWALLKV